MRHESQLGRANVNDPVVGGWDTYHLRKDSMKTQTIFFQPPLSLFRFFPEGIQHNHNPGRLLQGFLGKW